MIGQIIGDYAITDYLGQGELETYWEGRHNAFDDRAHIRLLKTVHTTDSPLRERYIAMLRADAQRQNLKEGVQFQILQFTQVVGMVTVTNGIEKATPEAIVAAMDDAKEGVFSKKGSAPDPVPPPNQAVMEDYHRQIQIFAKVSLVADVLMAIMLLVSAVWVGMDEINVRCILLGLAGLIFGAGLIAAIGLLEQRRWGRTALIVIHFTLFALGPAAMFIGEEGHKGGLSWEIRDSNYTLLQVSALPVIAFAIVGLVLAYSKKAPFYFWR